MPAIIIHSMYNLIIRFQILLGNSLGEYGVIAREGINGVFIVAAAIIMGLGYSKEKPYVRGIKDDISIKQLIEVFFEAPLLIVVILIYVLGMIFSIN